MDLVADHVLDRLAPALRLLEVLPRDPAEAGPRVVVADVAEGAVIELVDELDAPQAFLVRDAEARQLAADLATRLAAHRIVGGEHERQRVVRLVAQVLEQIHDDGAARDHEAGEVGDVGTRDGQGDSG